MSSPLVASGLAWLAAHQNTDGGWGDTLQSYSNVATSMLAVAAFHLAGETGPHMERLARAETYLDGQQRVEGLRRRYGRDKTFAVPILTNCALAGRVDWDEVSPLPFELACFPQELYRFLQLPVVSYAIPALVAIGQARFFHRPPWNPATRFWRARSVSRSMQVLERMQPASGGFLEAVPLTSFVLMSLAATGRADHPVARRAMDFLVRSVRPSGGWPIDTNLATWNTTLALNALAAGGEDLSRQSCLDWLLGCQCRDVHPYTGAAPGGWGWSDLSGSVPDADDTSGALLALASWSRSPQCHGRDRRRIRDAASPAIHWLCGLQNRDGGWPTFCRGWGQLPFDRSGADLTAHAVRALFAWSDLTDPGRAIGRGLAFLARRQQADGSWIPLWFGNQDHPREENPVYGTARVLLAYRDLQLMGEPPARRGLAWLVAAQNPDGGWGGGASVRARTQGQTASSVEETALAVEALWGAAGSPSGRSEFTAPLARGVVWLVSAVESGRWTQTSPIGFYFAKLWYHERLYPIIFVTSALGPGVRGRSTHQDPCSYSRRTSNSDLTQPKRPAQPA
jgi:squalene-hopene/tetraprenyl-beta-curcumene cyclase